MVARALIIGLFIIVVVGLNGLSRFFRNIVKVECPMILPVRDWEKNSNNNT
jgi:hypothetical protein